MSFLTLTLPILSPHPAGGSERAAVWCSVTGRGYTTTVLSPPPLPCRCHTHIFNVYYIASKTMSEDLVF